MPIDVLAPLYPHKGHCLYPVAHSKVLTEKRKYGPQAALRMAEDIAEAMVDERLEKRLR